MDGQICRCPGHGWGPCRGPCAGRLTGCSAWPFRSSFQPVGAEGVGSGLHARADKPAGARERLDTGGGSRPLRPGPAPPAAEPDRVGRRPGPRRRPELCGRAPRRPRRGPDRRRHRLPEEGRPVGRRPAAVLRNRQTHGERPARRLPRLHHQPRPDADRPTPLPGRILDRRPSAMSPRWHRGHGRLRHQGRHPDATAHKHRCSTRGGRPRTQASHRPRRARRRGSPTRDDWASCASRPVPSHPCAWPRSPRDAL